MGKKKSKGSGGKLLVFASSTLTGDQEAFIQKYIDKKYYLSKKKVLQAQVETSHESVVRKLGELEGIVSELASLVTEKRQYDIVSELRTKRGLILDGIGTTSPGLKETAAKLATADGKLDGLITDARDQRGKFTTLTGAELDDRAAIKKLRVGAQGQVNDLLNSWDNGVDVLRAELVKIAPDMPLDLPPDADLRPKYKAHSAAMKAAPADTSAGASAAKTEFDAIVVQMRTDAQVARRGLDTYAAGAFKENAGSVKLYQAISDKLEALEGLQAKLERWEIAGRAAFETETTLLEQRLDTLFGSGKPADEINRDAEGLDKEVDALSTRMAKAITDAEDAFAVARAKLLRAYGAYKGRLDALGKKDLPADQRAPIETFLAATRDSITKLGGANPDAVKAALIMLKDAEAMVSQAERIGPINEEIKDNIKRAKSTLKPLVKDKATVTEPATDLQKKVVEFEGAWLKQAPDDALKEARALSTRAIELEGQNTTLLRLRALMDTKIAEAEKKFTAFNAKFKEMLAWQGTKDVRDYRGPMRADIDGVITWNATKMDVGFYSTIASRIDTLIARMDARIDDIDEAMTSTPGALADAALKAREDYELALFGLDLEAGAGGKVDQEALGIVKAAYDEAMRKNAVHTDLSRDLLEEERKDAVSKADREKFLADGKQWVKDTRKALKAANEGDPFKTFSDEVERQIIRLEATLKAADKDKKGSTGTRGLAELKEITRAVDRIAARGTTTAKDKLGEIPGKWTEAVDEFRKSVNALVPAVESFEDDMALSSSASRALDGVLDEVLKRMALTELEEPAGVLGASNPPKSAAERKAAREAALSEVRRLKKLILEDPVVKSCVANPFGVAGFASATVARLEQIELDVLRGA